MSSMSVAGDDTPRATSTAWEQSGPSLSALFAARDTDIAPRTLSTVREVESASQRQSPDVQSTSQAIAAAAYSIVAQGQASQYGQLDLLR